MLSNKDEIFKISKIYFVTSASVFNVMSKNTAINTNND